MIFLECRNRIII